MKEYLVDKYVKYMHEPAGNSGLEIEDILDGDGYDCFLGFQGGYVLGLMDAEEEIKKLNDYIKELEK